MSRPRKPTELLELNGAFKRNPKRKRRIGPKPKDGIGDPPEYFREDERLAWREIVADCAPTVLTSAERTVVELLSRLRAKFRSDWLTGAEMGVMTWCCGRLGMTPADRSKVAAPDRENEPRSPFAAFGRPQLVKS